MFGLLKMLRDAYDDWDDLYPSRQSRGGVCNQVLACRNCRRVFGRRRGPESLLHSIDATGPEQICPVCGGRVVWK
jgi:rRNA maturation endonuclease Nob1